MIEHWINTGAHIDAVMSAVNFWQHKVCYNFNPLLLPWSAPSRRRLGKQSIANELEAVLFFKKNASIPNEGLH